VNAFQQQHQTIRLRTEHYVVVSQSQSQSSSSLSLSYHDHHYNHKHHGRQQQHRKYYRTIKPTSSTSTTSLKAVTAVTAITGFTTSATAVTIIKTAFQSSAVQKILELSVITCIGYSLRNKLGNPNGITSLLLNALVPSIIITSLSGLVSISSETISSVVGCGILLSIIQIIRSELSSRFVIPKGKDGSTEENNI